MNKKIMLQKCANFFKTKSLTSLRVVLGVQYFANRCILSSSKNAQICNFNLMLHNNYVFKCRVTVIVIETLRLQ